MVVYDPRQFKKLNNRRVTEWRRSLKLYLCQARQWKSDWSGKWIGNGCHMHEGILTRANVPRSLDWHYLIYHEVNCFLLLPEEHIPQPPSRQWCYERACNLYGKGVVLEWFYNLPFKVRPFELE